jgi:hypothetical protein
LLAAAVVDLMSLAVAEQVQAVTEQRHHL